MASPLCLVTGGTSGVGREAAVQLAQRGMSVLITGRNRARGEETVAAIRQAGGQAEFLSADFASLANVRALADEVRSRHDRIDVLINNAGLAGRRTRQLTVDGFEETFAVNHLAPFLLTALLRDRLSASGTRIVNVASEAHGTIRGLDFENLQGERRYKPILAYSVSKLANVLFTYELARRLEGTGVTANCIHPGVVSTRIWERIDGVLGFVFRVARVFMISPKKGGGYIARLADDPALAGVSGKYFSCAKETASSPASHDEATAARLWRLSEEMVGL